MAARWSSIVPWAARQFDAAFRREIKLIYPDKSLQPLPADHPVMTFVSDSEAVCEFAPLGQAARAGRGCAAIGSDRGGWTRCR